VTVTAPIASLLAALAVPPAPTPPVDLSGAFLKLLSDTDTAEPSLDREDVASAPSKPEKLEESSVVAGAWAVLPPAALAVVDPEPITSALPVVTLSPDAPEAVTSRLSLRARDGNSPRSQRGAFPEPAPEAAAEPAPDPRARVAPAPTLSPVGPNPGTEIRQAPEAAAEPAPDPRARVAPAPALSPVAPEPGTEIRPAPKASDPVPIAKRDAAAVRDVPTWSPPSRRLTSPETSSPPLEHETTTPAITESAIAASSAPATTPPPDDPPDDPPEAQPEPTPGLKSDPDPTPAPTLSGAGATERPLRPHARAQLAFAARLRPAPPLVEPAKIRASRELAQRVDASEQKQAAEPGAVSEPRGAAPDPPRTVRREMDDAVIERPSADRRIDLTVASRSEDRPAVESDEEPATAPPEAPKVAPRRDTTLVPPVARDIRLEVASPDRKVEVRLVERSGEVHFAVRTPDARLAEGLRGELSQLSTRLEQAGFHAEEWRIASASGAERRLDISGAASSSNDTRQHEQPGDGGQKQREQQSAPRQPDAPRRNTQKGTEFAWLMQSLR
jgi:hypothetical protein